MKQMFLTASANSVMDDIVKKLPKKPEEYRVAFITTASEPETGDLWWLRADREKLEELGFGVDEFSITGMKRDELKKRMEYKNMIFGCGGNPFYLLDQMIKTRFDEILKNKIESGVVYIGSSAGAMVVAKNIDLVATEDEKSKASDLKSDGLGIIDVAILPHWGDKGMLEDYKKGFEAMYVEDVKIVPISNKQYVRVKESGYEIVQI